MRHGCPIRPTGARKLISRLTYDTPHINWTISRGEEKKRSKISRLSLFLLWHSYWKKPIDKFLERLSSSSLDLRNCDSTKSTNRLDIANLISSADFTSRFSSRSSSSGKQLQSRFKSRFATTLPPTYSRSTATLSRFVCLLHGPWTASFSAQAGRLNVVLIK